MAILSYCVELVKANIFPLITQAFIVKCNCLNFYCYLPQLNLWDKLPLIGFKRWSKEQWRPWIYNCEQTTYIHISYPLINSHDFNTHFITKITSEKKHLLKHIFILKVLLILKALKLWQCLNINGLQWKPRLSHFIKCHVIY